MVMVEVVVFEYVVVIYVLLLDGVVVFLVDDVYVGIWCVVVIGNWIFDFVLYDVEW